jgi:hypothetical protein
MAAIITATVVKLRFVNMLALLTNMAPKLVKLGRGANNGMINEITKGMEKIRTNLVFDEYVSQESLNTFPIPNHCCDAHLK